MKIQQRKVILLIAFIAITNITYSDAKILSTQEKQTFEKQLTNAIKERDQATREKNSNKFIQAQKKFLTIKSKLSQRS